LTKDRKEVIIDHRGFRFLAPHTILRAMK